MAHESTTDEQATVTITEADAEHISRLRALRDSGAVNMFTELLMGLTEMWGEEGRQTYEWVTDNWDLYESSVWTDVDTSELPTEVEL